MRLKALMLVLLVFVATFATFSAFVATNYQGGCTEVRSNQSPSLILVGNDTIIRPMEPIDTPGGPT